MKVALEEVRVAGLTTCWIQGGVVQGSVFSALAFDQSALFEGSWTEIIPDF